MVAHGRSFTSTKSGGVAAGLAGEDGDARLGDTERPPPMEVAAEVVAEVVGVTCARHKLTPRLVHTARVALNVEEDFHMLGPH